MNIFYLHSDPNLCAKYHCDKHLSKMQIEYAQILSTAHWHNDTWQDWMYKPTHKNHPCVLWAADSRENYTWLSLLLEECAKEFCKCRDKWHKSGLLAPAFYLYQTGLRKPFSTPPQCMPDKYKQLSTIQAYRDYYVGEKKSFATWNWKGRSTPYWWKRHYEVYESN